MKSELHIFSVREVRTTYFVKSKLHIRIKREVTATYFVKSKLHICKIEVETIFDNSEGLEFREVKTTYSCNIEENR